MRRELSSLLIGLASTALLPLSAQAQSAETWKYGAAIYGWFPAISGDLALPAHGSSPSIGVSMGEVIDSLEFAFMGSFEASHGRWGVFTDLVYASFGATKTLDRDFTVGGVLPVDVSGDFNLDVKSWIWTLTGMYKMLDTPDAKADLLFGVRLLDMTNRLDWSLTAIGGGNGGGPEPSAARGGRRGALAGTPYASGSDEASMSNWDALIGVKGRIMLGQDKRWFVNYLADIGTGQSDLTYQGLLGIGYDFSWGSAVAAWRYMGYEFDSASKVQDLNFNGPLIGVVLRW